MKYKKILTWACTAALFLTGCTTDTVNNGRWMEDSNAVRIQASAGSTLTRSNPIATDEKQTGFNQGDKISVRNRNITVNYTLNGEIWQPVDNDKYLVWDKNDLKFEAYYPCDDKNTFSVGYIEKDQSTPEALAKSDYMNITYDVPKVPSDKHLTLKLERKTARLILRIQHFNDEFSKGVKVNKLDIGCPENTNGDGSWAPITPYQQNGDGGVGTTYTALVIPGKRTVYITPPNTNPDEPGIEDLKVETGELEAGKSYTYNLIVGKDKVTVGGVTVAPWNTENTLQGGEAKEEDLTPYVTMTAASKQTFVMKCAGNYTLPDLEYSVNNGKWQKVVADKCVDFGGALGSLRLRGICPNGTATSWQNYSTITFSDENVKVDCSGDIRMLIDYTAHETVATANCSFRSLFQNCKALKSAPELPATALKANCYTSMFSGCTSLTEAPKLPATKLANGCYSEMFKECASLVNAPDLPATTLEANCYSSMFIDCSKLTGAPELKAKIMQNASYHSMFKGCTSLVNAPALPATTLNYNCYISMFSGCTSLKTAPELGAEKMWGYCYQLMFENCTNLESVTMLATSGNPNGLAGWLDGAGTSAGSRTLKVSSKAFYNSTIAGKNPDIWKIGENCTVLDKDGKEITE